MLLQIAKENRLLDLATLKKKEEDEKFLKLVKEQEVLHSHYFVHLYGENSF
jgi:hypothetical protein